MSTTLTYAEGRHKPLLRGVLHYYGSYVIPTCSFLILHHQCNLAQEVMMLLITSLCIWSCLFTSGCYHCFKWTKMQELTLQKFDYICILFNSFGSFLPLTFYIQNGHYYFTYLSVITLLGSLWIWYDYKKVYAHIISGASILVLFEAVKKDISFDIALHSFNVVLIYLVGLIIFMTRKPDPLPNIFGYHELFHVLTIISIIYTYYVHYQLYLIY